MSRPLRIEYEDAFYHEMNRGRGRENTFLSDGDFRHFYTALSFITAFNYLKVNYYHLKIEMLGEISFPLALFRS
ncbi:hypothetical protein EJ103_13540 [Pseudoalteromonas sp. Xi13]|nr:hypothetical protein EJ103_13540 [Pseudoalteromonas sp. Xi13]